MVGPIDFSWLELDVPQRHPLARQPVVLVLAVVQFYPVLKVDRREYVAAFQDAIRTDYPAFEAGPLPPPIQVQMPGVAFDPSANVPPTWLFQDVKREWTITLSRESLAIETRAYPGFDEFKMRFSTILDALVAHIVPSLGTRIGLRFFDEIRPYPSATRSASRSKHDGIDWQGVVRHELLGVAANPVFQGKIQQSLQQLLLRDKHGIGINITHGIVPEGSMIDPPSLLSQQHPSQGFYLLDIDTFQVFEREKEFAVGTEFIISRIESFHEAISRIFRWSLENDFLESLQKED